MEEVCMKAHIMKTNDQSTNTPAQTWLQDAPVAVQSAFEAMATMQLLQEAADNAEAVLKVTGSVPADPALAASLNTLHAAATTRLVEVARQQIQTLRVLLNV
jgi:hypothetical protein